MLEEERGFCYEQRWFTRLNCPLTADLSKVKSHIPLKRLLTYILKQTRLHLTVYNKPTFNTFEVNWNSSFAKLKKKKKRVGDLV